MWCTDRQAQLVLNGDAGGRGGNRDARTWHGIASVPAYCHPTLLLRRLPLPLVQAEEERRKAQAALAEIEQRMTAEKEAAMREAEVRAPVSLID